jgi:hypothetical protein
MKAKTKYGSEKLMKKQHKRIVKKSKSNKGLLLFGVTNLLWFIFRTGTKPSRIVYPCQRAALANSSTLLSASILLSLTACVAKTEKFFSRRGKTLALLFVVATAMINIQQFWGSLQAAQAVDPYKELRLVLEPRNATALPASDIYVVSGRVPAPISELINFTGSHGLLFYKSNRTEVNQGPDGLIACDDVVLIKINEQWDQRGGTNTDLLKELIQAIVGHPDGFVGEIVVADNGQGYGRMNWAWSNAENHSQSTQAVVDMFSPFYNVSTYDWQPIRGARVDEYSDGDMRNGYILYHTPDPETGIYVSYPKFETRYGTYISFKYGVWNGTGYEKRLKIINMPVLKSHWTYSVTASVKHYMGVQSEGHAVGGGLANGHNTVGRGGMGTLMAETGLPTLNIIDAIWINANPPSSTMSGPDTHYTWATRVNVLMASTDPVALDHWAAKYVLEQTASIIGYTNTQLYYEERFGRWLNLSRNEIVAADYNITTDESHMNVYVYEAPDTAPPIVSILSPENKTYSANTVPLTFNISESTSWIGHSLNGQANVTIAGNITLTSLSNRRHNIVIYANDTSSNMGQSNTVYFTVDTTPPNITNIIQYPQPDNVLPKNEVKVNATVTDVLSTVKQVTLNYTNGNGTWITVNMANLGGNVWNATIPAFPYCTNVTYMVIAEDNASNTITTEEMGHEYQYHVIPEYPSSDNAPPTISILSPKNKTYTSNDVPLTFTVSESTSWIGYSLDGQQNQTITGNTTLSELSDGLHSLIVYAEDTSGNIGASEIVHFTVETLEPEPFPIRTVVAIVIIAGASATVLVYFTRIKKTTGKGK